MINVYIPILYELRETLAAFADEWKDIPMLARTHGQPAVPTTLGKEMANMAVSMPIIPISISHGSFLKSKNMLP